MTDEAVTSKGRMYDALASGRFGNTIPQWFSLAAWRADPEAARYRTWGVRTLTPGGPCAMYVPAEDVPGLVADFEARGHRCNISVMVDAVCGVTLYADVYDSETGLIVYCVEDPGRGASWRKVMPEKGRQFAGIAARLVLQRHLNPSSLSDLWALFDRWPGHVVELSALDRCFGTVPGRNAVVWEVRSGAGDYEKWV